MVTDLLLKLSEQMKYHKGKKVYGYLPQAGRNLVNAVVDELAKEKDISALYDLWCEQRDAITCTYQDTPEQRIPLSQNKEFKAIKNAVIQESLNILYDRITFEEAITEQEEIAPDEQEPEKTKSESSEKNKWWNDPDHPLFQYWLDATGIPEIVKYLFNSSNVAEQPPRLAHTTLAPTFIVLSK